MFCHPDVNAINVALLKQPLYNTKNIYPRIIEYHVMGIIAQAPLKKKIFLHTDSEHDLPLSQICTQSLQGCLSINCIHG